jgi:3-oxoacyl-[acyl-carrier protein] reductase
VEELAEDHDVALHYNSDQKGAEEAADAAKSQGAETVLVQADFTNQSAIEAMVAQVTDEFGALDVLVNNAGVDFHADLLEMTPKEFEATLTINLEGMIHCTRAVLGGMLENDEGGRIVSVSSRAGVRGSNTDAVYGASKGGVTQFTLSLARQYTDQGIFSNVVAPGAVDTKMYPDEYRPAKREESPIGRLVKPEDVAHAIRLFAETESISGRVLEIDGGQV